MTIHPIKIENTDANLKLCVLKSSCRILIAAVRAN
jgi:hypothetical protein